MNRKARSCLSKFIFSCGLLLCVAACASLQSTLNPPDVELTSVKLLPTNGFSQPLLIGLTITNPNSADLSIEALSYDLKLLSQPILSGTGGDLPTVPSYGKVEIAIPSSISLLDSWQFLKKLLANPGQPVSYQLEAEITLSGIPFPISIHQSGETVLGSN
ncbi:MAG: LEA type 2 family protein [Pseudomonadales bacterium]|nr:LEA type 2 family protein [Pseudomonadales bacterium]